MNLDNLKSYVINLKRRPNKLENFKNMCPIKNIKTFNAIDGFNLTDSLKDHGFNENVEFTNMRIGEMGCFLSHMILWKNQIYNDDDYIFIFEDDPFFNKDFKDTLKKILNNFNDFDSILYVGGRYVPNFVMNSNFIKVNENIVKTDYSKPWNSFNCDRGTFSYIIHKKCAQIFLNEIRETKYVNYAVDKFMTNTLRKHNINMFSTNPLLCYHPLDDSKSDIQRSTRIHTFTT